MKDKGWYTGLDRTIMSSNIDGTIDHATKQ